MLRRAGLAALMGLGAAQAWAGLAVEVGTGTAFSAGTSLTLRQDGFPPLEVDASWETRPFQGAPYYVARVGWWSRQRGWEIELLHHKLYLDNTGPEVSRFEVTHGFNVVTVARAWDTGNVIWRIGAGGVLAHAESTVRGRSSDEGGGVGYAVTGPALQAGVARAFRSGRFLQLAAELQGTAARARVPIAGGDASVPNLALHVRVSVRIPYLFVGAGP